MFIIANAGLFAFLITRAGVPDAIGHWLESVLQSPAMFLLGVNAALFVIGMFIETSAAIIVLAPILAPVAQHFGIDPVHFGLIMVVNLALGMITPPFGVNLFAACTVARISLDRIIPHLDSVRAGGAGLPDGDHLRAGAVADAARPGVRTVRPGRRGRLTYNPAIVRREPPRGAAEGAGAQPNAQAKGLAIAPFAGRCLAGERRAAGRAGVHRRSKPRVKG